MASPQDNNNNNNDGQPVVVVDEKSLTLKLWYDKWENQQLGWHNEGVHPVLTSLGHLVQLPSVQETTTITNTTTSSETTEPLSSSKDAPPETQQEDQQHVDKKAKPASLQVFVPLCGKTVDMAYLASHPNVQKVVGIDGIAQAITEFQAEQPQLNLQPVVTSNDANNNNDDKKKNTAKFRRWKGSKIELLQGDFFDLTPQDIISQQQQTQQKQNEPAKEQEGTETDPTKRQKDAKDGFWFDVIFDRASLVAIDPSLRESYVRIMGSVLRPRTGQILLVVFERLNETERHLGPPYHFDETTVRTLYESQPWVHSVQPLLDHDVPEDRPASSTSSHLQSKYYLIQAK